MVHFELIVIPSGLANTPAAFMSIVKNTFHIYSDTFKMAYVDDILIYIQA